MQKNIFYKSPFYIGDVKLDNNILLAPMAGITDMPFRVICKEKGCGMVFSEMISAKGVHYGSKGSLELAFISESENPAAIQIFGSDPQLMADAAVIFQNMGASIIDINMGCPAPKVTNSGDGSALMKDPLLAGRIIRAVSDAVTIPVTVKIRRGWSEAVENALEMALIAENNGASAVTVHGRFSSQFYAGSSDHNTIASVKRALSIPVIGNGDIFCATDAVKLFEDTGCDAIMIARGAQGNPWIFSQTLALLTEGAILPHPCDTELFNTIKRHIEMVVAYKSEDVGIREMRKHIAWYLKGMKNSAIIRDTIFKLSTVEQVLLVLGEYFKELSEATPYETL